MYNPIQINNPIHKSGDKDGDKLTVLIIDKTRITEMYRTEDGECVIEVRANEYSFDSKEKTAYDYFEVSEPEFQRVSALILSRS